MLTILTSMLNWKGTKGTNSEICLHYHRTSISGGQTVAELCSFSRSCTARGGMRFLVACSKISKILAGSEILSSICRDASALREKRSLPLGTGEQPEKGMANLPF